MRTHMHSHTHVHVLHPPHPRKHTYACTHTCIHTHMHITCKKLAQNIHTVNVERKYSCTIFVTVGPATCECEHNQSSVSAINIALASQLIVVCTLVRRRVTVGHGRVKGNSQGQGRFTDMLTRAGRLTIGSTGL